MITIEDVKRLNLGLSDELMTAIVTLSNNSETAAISKRIGELHSQYDTDILAISGLAKNGSEKSYDYAKRVLGDYKDKLAKAEAKVTELNDKIEKGSGDETIKQQLADSKSLVSQLQAKLKESEKNLETEKANGAKALLDLQVTNAFNVAMSGIKFKDGITEPVQKALLQAAKGEIAGRGTFEVQDNGTLVIRDGKGEILRNPNNQFNPYTVSELLMESSLKDVVDTGRKQTGGGTGNLGGSGGGDTITALDLSQARSQVEADAAIESYLLGQGFTRDSAEFAEKSMQIRVDNKIADLPIRN